MRKKFSLIVAVLIIAGIFSLLFFSTIRQTQTPTPTTIPSIVNESMDSLLQSLEAELAKHNPDTIKFLQPGITVEELERAEATLEIPIHPEMQALYRWHNGLANDKELFPGHGFWSLEAATQTHQEFLKMGLYFLLPNEKYWLILFPDSAGDGYYYDPKRNYATGGVFYVFREAGYYRFFPSIKNLLRAIVECYQNGVYPHNADPDFEIEEQIMSKYGVEYQDY